MNKLLLTLIFNTLLAFQNDLSTHIILINGEAHLVVLDEKLFIVEVLQAVPYYFSSNLNHEQIVQGLKNQKQNDNQTFYANNEDRFVSKTEVDVLDNAEFIQFLPAKALLNRIAVSRIRQIADDYLDGGIDRIDLSIVYKNTSVSDLLTENRLNSVKDLMVAFGIDENIITVQKELRNQYDNNPFVRVAYKKKVQ